MKDVIDVVVETVKPALRILRPGWSVVPFHLIRIVCENKWEWDIWVDEHHSPWTVAPDEIITAATTVAVVELETRPPPPRGRR